MVLLSSNWKTLEKTEFLSVLLNKNGLQILNGYIMGRNRLGKVSVFKNTIQIYLKFHKDAFVYSFV